MKLRYKIRSLWLELCLRFRVLFAAVTNMTGGDITPTGRLYATKMTVDGGREYLGLISTKVVTDVGVQFLVNNLRVNIATIGNMKFHGSGTGSTAESAAQTALVTEVGTRATGTQIVGGSANVYRTVGTVTYAGTFAIVEHAIFDAATVGTMFDRSLFTAINVLSTDSIEFTYDLTLPSGS